MCDCFYLFQLLVPQFPYLYNEKTHLTYSIFTRVLKKRATLRKMAAEEEDVRLSFSHKYQLDKYQIILNNQDIDLKTEQSPQQKGEGDEKATLKKVESMEI